MFSLWRLPMYSEAKLAFFIYLWFPKTKVSETHWDGEIISFLKNILIQLAFSLIWYPLCNKPIQGTTYVYDSFFRPYISKHENEIDRSLVEVRTRAGDMAMVYLQKVINHGQTRFFEVLQYIAEHSTPKSQSEVMIYTFCFYMHNIVVFSVEAWFF